MAPVTARNSRSADHDRHASVAERIRNDIVGGEIFPGERLNEAELSEKYGVSRTPVREAIRQLEQEGLVFVQRYRGASVIKLKPVQIRSLFEAREAIEGMSAFLATERMPKRLVGDILDKLYQHADALHGGEDLRPPVDVHQLLLDGSANEYLQSTMSRYQGMLATFRAESVRVASRRSQSSREHIAILDAIHKGDAIAAEQAMRAHVRSVKRNVLSFLETDD